MARTKTLWIVAVLVIGSRVWSAQDVTGDWQGTLPAGPPGSVRCRRIDRAYRHLC